jgi:hypothetical protein
MSAAWKRDPGGTPAPQRKWAIGVTWIFTLLVQPADITESCK